MLHKTHIVSPVFLIFYYLHSDLKNNISLIANYLKLNRVILGSIMLQFLQLDLEAAEKYILV